MNDGSTSSNAVTLALQMGAVQIARELFNQCDHLNGRLGEAPPKLASMLLAAEGVEIQFGKGALLDLDHPMVSYLVNRGQIEPSQAETAQRFSNANLTSSALDEFVPGLTRHQARQLPR